MTMIRNIALGTVILSAAIFPVGPWFGPALAQDGKSRSIEQYTCKDVMRESGSNRDVAIAFLHGYLLGKSGNSAFDLDTLHKQTSDFIEHCLDNPAEKAVDAMSKVKG
jgi:HdeA/HdeB family